MRQENDTHDDPILAEACAWFVRLQSAQCPQAERAEFDRWLASGEAQRAAYARAETLWASLDELRGSAIPGLAEARAARGRSKTRSRRSLIGLLLLISVGSSWWFWAQRAITYETALGEVAPDPVRPFVVTAGALRIHDIGTRFDVDRRPERVTVAVLEGLVQIDDGQAVQAERIASGHRRSYAFTGWLGPDEAIDASEVSAWREGRLRFKSTPLAEVAAELERYHPIRFVFADPKLRGVPLSGTFDSADLDPFAILLLAIYAWVWLLLRPLTLSFVRMRSK